MATSRGTGSLRQRRPVVWEIGLRRGELAALRFDDLNGRVLRIERSVSAEELTTPKSGRGRCITLGAATALLWTRLEGEWR